MNTETQRDTEQHEREQDTKQVENAPSGRAPENGLYAELTREIIAAAIEVHRQLGPGLLESAYAECLCHELKLRGLSFRREIDLPVDYKGLKLDCGYRIDLVVNDSVVLELKSIDQILRIHEAQLLTYLRLSQKRVGLLINFNVAVLRDGIRRRIL